MRNVLRRLGNLFIGLSDFGRDKTAIDLTGDRAIEWSWVAAHIPENPGAVLDFGCGDTSLSLVAAAKGGNVTGIDIQQVQLPYRVDNLKIRTGDILNFDFGEMRFDVIINCSAIEHVGLAGRYGSADVSDGDLIAMEKMCRLLKSPEGIMILTIPVGKDSVFPPLHRVYGAQRLNMLFRGFSAVKKEFWSKRNGLNVWIKVSEEEALSVQPSESFYAMGLFILKANNSMLPDVR
ncbi:MAG: DUF268 domain-containing protein [Nitrospinae bacterium]|nr:DUF268 domain-containing protein [Nitrospinota bacterium]MBI3813117.1 DUF268 domain-containing protein [Nitrospinota bacterium]